MHCNAHGSVGQCMLLALSLFWNRKQSGRQLVTNNMVLNLNSTLRFYINHMMIYIGSALPCFFDQSIFSLRFPYKKQYGHHLIFHYLLQLNIMQKYISRKKKCRWETVVTEINRHSVQWHEAPEQTKYIEVISIFPFLSLSRGALGQDNSPQTCL